jgi:methionyl-tRNA formyltransferase
MKIVYCGYGRAGFECLNQLLIRDDVLPENILVFTHESTENESFISLLKALQIDFFTSSINKEIEAVAAYNPDFLLSVYYRYIIKEEVLDLFKSSFNCHPSLLPDYRGCFSGAWAIINGETKTGITFHKMDAGVDTGKIYLQKDLEIGTLDTAYSLYHKLVTTFVFHFNEAFEILIGSSQGSPQSEQSNTRYYSRSVPYEGTMKATEVTFKQACDFFRGMYFPPFENAKFEFDEGTIEVLSLSQLENYREQFLRI